MLRKWGYDVLTARDGRETLSILGETESPFLLILDWMMPLADGLEVCRTIRGASNGIYRYVIMLTAKTSNDDLIAGLEAGADDYIAKPFKSAELRARIKVGERILALQDALRTQALLDALTGLFNRGAILQALEREYARAVRFGTLLAVLMADVDKFKTLNDSLGHVAGDQALRTVAATMQSAVRASDLVGRYGGDEFFIVLPDCGEDAALGLAQRVQKQVNEALLKLLPPSLVVTLSIGAAVSVMVREYDVITLISEADKALYEAKHSGRNSVILHKLSQRTEQ
jgi:diguanylate cyclase (GGDEF)-like protein